MIIDLIAALIITYGFYRGFQNGLIDTIFDTLSIMVGLVLALKFSPLLIDYLQEVVNINPAFEFILGFIIVFFAVMLLIRFIADRMEGILKAVKMNFINQILGGALLGFVFAFCIGLALSLLTDFKILNTDYISQSTLFDYLLVVKDEGGWVIETFKQLFSEFWVKFIDTVESVKQNLSEN